MAGPPITIRKELVDVQIDEELREAYALVVEWEETRPDGRVLRSTNRVELDVEWEKS